ncbi:MAG: tRNA pseudouridine(38-40) synthase TruA [Mycoplasmataceae bacterium]|nr:tRNA pseudouridine(38-40) synthase TruA [Mycoplasmataceae bacterium]
MNYQVTVSYDGSDFHGWAKQQNVRTIQGEIEKIIYRIFKQPITIHASGRTDAYVHAYGQVFSFNAKKSPIKPNHLLSALRNLSPTDIYFVKVKVNKSMFHARFSAHNKTYQYVVNTGDYNVFKSRYELFYNRPIDLKLLKKTSKLFIGTHDFKSFSTSILDDTIRTINYIKFKSLNNSLIITINGDGFLRNMVRMIIGSLLDVNEHKKTMEHVAQLLKDPFKGSAITKVNGCGLYLLKVNY